MNLAGADEDLLESSLVIKVVYCFFWVQRSGDPPLESKTCKRSNVCIVITTVSYRTFGARLLHIPTKTTVEDGRICMIEEL